MMVSWMKLPPRMPKVSMIAVPMAETWPGVRDQGGDEHAPAAAPNTAASTSTSTASGSPQLKPNRANRRRSG